MVLDPKGDHMVQKYPKPKHDVILQRGCAHATPDKDGLTSWLFIFVSFLFID